GVRVLPPHPLQLPQDGENARLECLIHRVSIHVGAVVDEVGSEPIQLRVVGTHEAPPFVRFDSFSPERTTEASERAAGAMYSVTNTATPALVARSTIIAVPFDSASGLSTKARTTSGLPSSSICWLRT